jgi:hypothetical protein
VELGHLQDLHFPETKTGRKKRVESIKEKVIFWPFLNIRTNFKVPKEKKKVREPKPGPKYAVSGLRSWRAGK